MLKFAAFIFAIVVSCSITFAAERVIKVHALRSGDVVMDGKRTTLDAFNQVLAAAKGKVVVWYYREDAEQKANPAQMKVIKAIIDNRASVSLSTKPDFSDYVDTEGRTHPRSR